MAAEFEKFRLTSRHNYLDYAHMLRKLLPKGSIWGFLLPSDDDVLYDSFDGSPDLNDASSGDELNDTSVGSSILEPSMFGKFWLVIGGELARLEERAYQLMNESTAGLSVELIENYREQYIRDDIEDALIETTEDIQRLAHAKEYDASVPFTASQAEAIALNLGFTVDVTEGSSSANPLICGVGVCGDQECGNRGIFATILIEVLAGTANYELMQSVLENLKPAHTVIVWDDQR